MFKTKQRRVHLRITQFIERSCTEDVWIAIATPALNLFFYRQLFMQVDVLNVSTCINDNFCLAVLIRCSKVFDYPTECFRYPKLQGIPKPSQNSLTYISFDLHRSSSSMKSYKINFPLPLVRGLNWSNDEPKNLFLITPIQISSPRFTIIHNNNPE